MQAYRLGFFDFTRKVRVFTAKFTKVFAKSAKNYAVESFFRFPLLLK